MASISLMKAVLTAFLLKAEAIQEMKRSRYAGVGLEVCVVGGRERVDGGVVLRDIILDGVGCGKDWVWLFVCVCCKC